jgi:hypothetical protein
MNECFIKYFTIGLDVIVLEIVNFLQEMSQETEKDENEHKDLNLQILNFFEEFSVIFFVSPNSIILKEKIF